MKKIYKKLLIGILCLCLFTSCKSNKQRAGGERTSTEETKSTEILKGSNTETTESKEPRTTSETETAKEKNYKNLIEEDGAYMASIIASDKGEVNEYNMSSVYEVQLDEDVIIVKGSFNYSEDYDGMTESDDKILSNDEYSFKIDASTKYMAVGGMNEPSDIGLERFLSYFKEVENSGLGLIIIVENGVSKEVLISS